MCGTPLAPAPAPSSSPPPSPTPAAAAPAPMGNHRNGTAVLPPLPPPPHTAAQRADPGFGFGAPEDVLIAGVSARPRAVGPDTMLAPVPAPAAPTPRFGVKHAAIGAAVILLIAAGVYSLLPHGGGTKEPPTVLAPLPPASGIPTKLSDVVRIAAESARHTALTTVIEAAGTSGDPLTPAQLAAEQPSYQWVVGNEPSTTNTVVSITSGPGIDVIAVSGTDRDICAFGRWSPAYGSEYVTMAHVEACAATNAPTDGWTTQRGGSAQDLPGLDGS